MDSNFVKLMSLLANMQNNVQVFKDFEDRLKQEKLEKEAKSKEVQEKFNSEFKSDNIPKNEDNTVDEDTERSNSKCSCDDCKFILNYTQEIKEANGDKDIIIDIIEEMLYEAKKIGWSQHREYIKESNEQEYED